MRVSRPKTWAAVIAVLAITTAAVYGIRRSRYRAVQSNPDLLHLLPKGDGTLFFADLAALRSAGYLGFLQAAQAEQEKDYAQFVRETGFDYAKDIDALAAFAQNQDLFFLARGRFDWNKIQSYMKSHGGECPHDLCAVAAKTPGRWASAIRIQPDVLGLAVSADKTAAGILAHSHPEGQPKALSDAPVWLKPAHSILSNPAQFPPALQIFAITFQSADSVVISLRRPANPAYAFDIDLDAAFENKPTAETARTQLEINTTVLKKQGARDLAQPGAGDLILLLTSGSFQTEGKHLRASWPVRPELLAKLR